MNKIVSIAALFCVQSAFACTEFKLQAKDDTIFITRTMEYGMEMHANLRTSPRYRQMTTKTPDGHKGLSWTSKYGFVFFDAMNVDVAVDGINEKGLSFGALYLPGFAQYQTVSKKEYDRALSYIHIGDWILGNFSSVDEVKNAIQKVTLFPDKVPGMSDIIFPLHFSVYDATGKGLVIEYVNGKLNLHENQIGVFTNSPPYDWQIAHLSNYANLSPFNPSPVSLNDVTLEPKGNGFGMLGLPGDLSPPSRFVKIATLLRVANPVTNSMEALNLAEHIVNTVDIPLGFVRAPHPPIEPGGFGIQMIDMETAQWTVFKDLTHKKIYFRTYGNTQLRMISLDELDFSKNAARLKMPVASTQVVLDMTEQFKKTD